MLNARLADIREWWATGALQARPPADLASLCYLLIFRRSVHRCGGQCLAMSAGTCVSHRALSVPTCIVLMCCSLSPGLRTQVWRFHGPAPAIDLVNSFKGGQNMDSASAAIHDSDTSGNILVHRWSADARLWRTPGVAPPARPVRAHRDACSGAHHVCFCSALLR